ncbi:MAG: L,D-transpeptidase [Planctomycetes bacterium]|nr:L,D-transpeptidase [Planctomycetota bacterium]
MARYPIYRQRKPKSTRRFVVLLLVAAAVVVLWQLWAKRISQGDGGENAVGAKSAGSTTAPKTDKPPQMMPATRPTGKTNGPNGGYASGTPAEREAAETIYRQGKELWETSKRSQDGKMLISTRAMLSEVMLSDLLDAELQDQVCAILEEIADKTIFSPRIYDGDTYAMQYTFQKRDRLDPVERRLKLHVPWRGLMMINRLTSPRRIRVDQQLKMIKGPFHAVVHKKRHVMDLYLHRPGMEKVFVRRVLVGLGKNDSTPSGVWRVAHKLVHGDYYPAANSLLKKRSIPYGAPGYAFGKKGLWIGLEGIGERTRGLTSYGIHSTNDATTIGKDSSEGCIRLSDKDIDLVFALLYEGWSKVYIKP